MIDDAQSDSRPKVVLIVEDEMLTALDLEQIVSKAGYVVCGTARSAREALDLASQCHPDLALMDVNLHSTPDGIATAGVLGKLYGTTILYVSGNAELVLSERAAETHPAGWVPKPFHADQIQAALRKAAARAGETPA